MFCLAGDQMSNSQILVLNVTPHPTVMQACQLTPQGHKDGEEDCGGVIEEVWRSGGATGSAEMPEVAGPVTQRTHGEIETLVTHLQTEGQESGNLRYQAPAVRCNNSNCANQAAMAGVSQHKDLRVAFNHKEMNGPLNTYLPEQAFVPWPYS